MRRTLLLTLVLAFAAPMVAEAQPRFLVAGGFSGPTGSFSDGADAGYHLQAGLYVAIPTLPVGLRGDGTVHTFGTPDPANERPRVLAGSLSLVYELPGVGLVPYMLGGIGAYELKEGLVDAAEKFSDNGYHVGFGVNLGTGGFGAFAEIRYVRVNGDERSYRMIPVTFGVRM